MTNNPLVSIVVVVYNTEKYLNDCMDSVVNQTYNNLEIICVDDCSTDNSLKILESYALKDSRIKIITNEKNSGSGITRNKGIDAAHGKYILFVDSDDWIDLTLCEMGIEAAKKNNSDMIFYSYYDVNEDKKIKKNGCPNLNQLENFDDSSRRALLIPPMTPWCRFWSLEFLSREKIRFTIHRRGQDQLPPWLGALLCEQVSIVDESLYYHRTNPGQITKSGDERSLSIIDVCQNLKDELVKRNLFDRFEDDFWIYKFSVIIQIYYTSNKLVKKMLLQKINLSVEEKKMILFTIRPLRKRLLFCPLLGGGFRLIGWIAFRIFKLFH